MSKNLNLSTFYESLEGKARGEKYRFINLVASKCGVSQNTVLRWVKGNFKTRVTSNLKILSEASGIPIEKLFEK